MVVNDNPKTYIEIWNHLKIYYSHNGIIIFIVNNFKIYVREVLREMEDMKMKHKINRRRVYLFILYYCIAFILTILAAFVEFNIKTKTFILAFLWLSPILFLLVYDLIKIYKR